MIKRGPSAYHPCRVVHEKYGSCQLTASYYAIDNRAPHGHICAFCWRQLSLEEQALYTLRP